MSRAKLTVDQVLDEGDSISTEDLQVLLKKLTKTQILDYAQQRFFGVAFQSSLTKDALIETVLDAHQSAEDVQIPSSEVGHTLTAVLANLKFSAPVDPETELQMSRRLPPPRLLDLDSAPEVVRRAGAVVVDSRNAPRVELPKTSTKVVSGPRTAPERIGKIREATTESSEEFQRILNDIDPDKLAESKGHGKGYSFGQLTGFRKRLNEAPGAPTKIPSTLKKNELIEKLTELLEQ